MLVWPSNMYDAAKSLLYETLLPVSVHRDRFLLCLIGLIWPTWFSLIAGQTLWGGHRFASHGDKSGGESKGHNLWLQRGCGLSIEADEQVSGGWKKIWPSRLFMREEEKKTCSSQSYWAGSIAAGLDFTFVPFGDALLLTHGAHLQSSNPLMYRSEPGPTPVG